MEQRSHVSLPQSQLQWLSDRARSCGYSSAEDYLSDLIRRDQALYAPHEAPSASERKKISEDLRRIARTIAERFEDVPPGELEAEIDAACEAVRRKR